MPAGTFSLALPPPAVWTLARPRVHGLHVVVVRARVGVGLGSFRWSCRGDQQGHNGPLPGQIATLRVSDLGGPVWVHFMIMLDRDRRRVCER